MLLGLRLGSCCWIFLSKSWYSRDLVLFFDGPTIFNGSKNWLYHLINLEHYSISIVFVIACWLLIYISSRCDVSVLWHNIKKEHKQVVTWLVVTEAWCALQRVFRRKENGTYDELDWREGAEVGGIGSLLFQHTTNICNHPCISSILLQLLWLACVFKTFL